MNVLVTGGAGYFGSVLVRMLLRQNHRVTVIDNFMYRQQSLTDLCSYKNLSIVNGDVRDIRVIAHHVKWADVIIPLAAIVGAPACSKNESAAWTTNTDAVRQVCQLADSTQLILYPNTNSGYGIGDEKLCTEESPLRPISIYGKSKITAENWVLNKRNGVSFRLATLFGTSARMRVDLMVNDFVLRAVRDRTLVLFEEHFRRNFVHVQDAAAAFIHAINDPKVVEGKVYNVGDSEANMTKKELCEKIALQVPGFVFHCSPIGEDPDKRDYVVSNDKIEKTGWRALLSLDDGIQELAKCFQQPFSGHGNV